MAGRKSTWASGAGRDDQITIRVPKVIAQQVKEYAHRLDAGEQPYSKNLAFQIKLLKAENQALIKQMIFQEKQLLRQTRFTSLAEMAEIIGTTVENIELVKNKCIKNEVLLDWVREKDPQHRHWQYSHKKKAFYLDVDK